MGKFMYKSNKFSVLTSLLFTIGAAAQNTFPATGNVGIGTTNPQGTLDVNGTFRTAGSSTIGNGAYSSSGPVLALGDGGYGFSSAQGAMFEYDPGNGMILSHGLIASGNVGIGTTSPTAPLHIAVGSITGSLQVNNGLTIQPASGSAYGANGVSIMLDSVTNHGIQPIAGIWSSLVNGGDGAVNYNGALVLGSVHQGGTVPVEGMRVDQNGYVGIGTTSPGASLEVNGSVKLTANSGASMTYPDGTVQSTAWNGTTFGGDYAESVDVTGTRGSYEPGDVLVLDRAHPGQFLKSDKPFSRLVAGVYSTRPGLTGHRHSMDGTASNIEVPMAMMGIVPTKVSAENGPIEIGDLLVSSSTEGYAMNAGNGVIPTGTVIGKSMGALKSGRGTIEVLISLQ
jgi:hypothetical protein